MDLTEKVAEAVRKVWDEYPNPITHHNLPMVRQDAARAAISVCAKEMAKRLDEEGYDCMGFCANTLRSIGAPNA